MILLRSAGAAPAHSVAVFGAGLVGSALIDRLRASMETSAILLPLDWSNPPARDRQLEAIGDEVVASCAERPGGNLTWVWSAGRAGFSAGSAETDAELGNFRAVLALWRRCAERLKSTSVRAVHFSSAGGLFEGQRQVNASSGPAPRRPYGELKLTEEGVLLSSGIPATVVRLSSVYGLLRRGQRAGLVSTLLANGIRHEVSSIYGSMDTLRDFVWIGDVASFVSKRILEPDRAEERPLLLASGRPSSIFEVQKIIEDVLGYKIYVGYTSAPSNREDITFGRDALPPDWCPTDLKTTVGIVYRDAIRRGYGS